MKLNVGLLLMLLAIFIGNSCSPDDEMPMQMDPDPMATLKNFSISIPDDYFSDVQGYTESGEMFILKDDGSVFDRSPLQNGETSTIELDEDLSANTFDLLLLTKGESASSTLYDFDMFSDVSAVTLDFLAPNTPQATIDQRAKITVNNTNSSFDDIHFSNNGGLSSGLANITFNIQLDSVPDHFYSSFYISDLEEFRYLWKENIGADETVTVDYTTLPIVEESSLFTFPANNGVRVEIDGKMNGQIEKNIVDFNNNIGTEQSNIYFPTSFFDKYHVKKFVSSPDFQLQYNSFAASIEYDFINPNITYAVQNSTVDDLKFQTSGDYTFYDAKYGFVNQTEGYQVSWSFLGGADPIIELAIPNIDIADIIGDNNFTNEDLKFNTIWLDKVEGIEGAEDHIYYRADRGRNWNQNLTYTRYIKN